MKHTFLIHSLLALGLSSAVAARNIPLQPGISGFWIAGADGQGITASVTRVDGQPVLALDWNTYFAGEQMWLVGAQAYSTGDTEVQIPLLTTRGGQWGEAFASEQVTKEEWGVLTLRFSDCDHGTLEYQANDSQFGSGTLPLTRITEIDGLFCREDLDAGTTAEASLAFMREEEKMARDVYLTFNQLYGVDVFSQISASEQRHMDAVLTLLTIYNLPDSATEEVGVFNNPELQALHDTLIGMGSDESRAYLAAALIEETDIRDLENAMGQLDEVRHADILSTYENLRCGSRNHLRSFVSRWESVTGETYQVQIAELTDEVLEILATPAEQCGQNP